MEPRRMPLATFLDRETGELVTVVLDLYERRTGKPDRCKPHPRRDGRQMALVQVQTDYDQGL